MNNVKRLAFCLFLLTFISTTVLADLKITGILYDPEGSDSGYEWIELYNPSTQPISLANYTIESGNGALADDWDIVWSGESTILNPGEYYLVGENLVSPTPDSISSLGLQNGPDSCRLKKQNIIIDLVGWGEHTFPEYYEGTPAIDVSNIPLVRRMDEGTYIDTANNSNDFEALHIIPKTKNTRFLSVSVEVGAQSLPILFSVPDDDSSTAGIQLMPLPGISRKVKINITIQAEDCDGITVNIEFNDEQYTSSRSDCKYTSEIEIPSSLPPQKYPLIINAQGEGITNSSELNITVLSLLAFKIDASSISLGKVGPGGNSEISGDGNMQTPANPTVQNQGNVILDLGFIGRDLKSSLSTLQMHNIIYSVGTKSDRLNSTMRVLDSNIALGAQVPLSFRVEIPSTQKPGIYVGDVALLAVES